MIGPEIKFRMTNVILAVHRSDDKTGSFLLTIFFLRGFGYVVELVAPLGRYLLTSWKSGLHRSFLAVWSQVMKARQPDLGGD